MKIGVIGAGTMGQGIAKAFAQVEGNTVALGYCLFNIQIPVIVIVFTDSFKIRFSTKVRTEITNAGPPKL